MARFHGEVGYGHSVETAPGVWDDTVVAKTYFGDVVRNTRRSSEGQQINNDLTVTNSIEIVADAYANEHFFAIRYVMWQGVAWHVTEVEVRHPRLVLRLGGVYNGPKGSASESP